MKHFLYSILFIYSFSSFSQVDTSNVILGNWKLKAIKTEASLRSFGDELENKSKIASDSLLAIKIKKDSIYIIRQKYGALKDTFAYTYSLKSDTSSYSNHKMELILYPSKSRLKGLRKWHRKTQKELGFTIIRLTNSQLVIQDAFSNNFPTNPFSNFTFVTYYFEKGNSNPANELAFKGKWYFNYSSAKPLESIDTLKLSRDSITNIEEFKFSINFNINLFKNNNLTFKEVSQPKPRTVSHGVLDGIYVRSHYFSTDWKIEPINNILTTQLNSKTLTFKYSFTNGQLLLVKNGS
jgi:hypothetical protein